ncbi:hypothetical protein EGR_10233 [Echinococcus granulosus]|uniref:Uncharacterized protein n=1 Tax=Echinococcus granulosus TaxID=6210 RepID=W6U1A9_ECHGR|nr:hypothetical protein EGR_10233 [Echinococcus granulosus]EUB54895.1 hypothetical protein EGR_10233 [Echinococcus granulosus]
MHSHFPHLGILPFVLLVCLNFTCLGSLRLSRRSGGHEREYEAPEISIRSVSPHWLNIQCTIPKSSSEFKVFVTCPALPSPCYENCLPTQSCSEFSSVNAECLPDRTAVNCTELVNSDGSKLTSLWIDKRSPRLHGSWVCTSLGVKSTVANVVPELEETPVVPPVLEVLEESPSLGNAKTVQPDNLKNTVGQMEENGKPPFYPITSHLSRTPWIFCLIAIFIISVTVNIILWCRWCLVCFFTARRRKYNEDQKTLGDMICLPTQMSRTQSGLWENDVFSSPLIDDPGEPCYLKENLSKFQRFGTFGPSNFAYEQSQLQNQTDLTEMAFPDYFNTLQPCQLWRTRSAVATFSPGNLSLTGGHSQSDTGSLNQVTSQSNFPPPPPPPPLPPNQSLHGTKEPKQPLRISTNPALGIATVYDDVASSSTIAVVSKDAKKPSMQLEPHLPSLIVARILARENPSIFEALFADPVGSKFGPDIADFAFYKNAFSLKQNVLFDTILVHIFPSYVDGKKTGGLEGKCIFIDTDSSFPLLAFVSFIENFLSTRYPSTPHSNMVDEILSRLYVVNARTTVECILALLTLRDIIKFDRKYLLVVGSISARFGLFPKKEIAIAELLFFDFLKYIVDTFHIQCICIRMLPSTKVDFLSR